MNMAQIVLIPTFLVCFLLLLFAWFLIFVSWGSLFEKDEFGWHYNGEALILAIPLSGFIPPFTLIAILQFIKVYGF